MPNIDGKYKKHTDKMHKITGMRIPFYRGVSFQSPIKI